MVRVRFIGSIPISGSVLNSVHQSGSVLVLSMNCSECGDETSNPKFCSLSCSAKSQMRQQKAQREIPRKPCEYCETEFTYGTLSGSSRTARTRFCNRSCAASFNNSKVPKRQIKSTLNLHCKNCADPLTNRHSTYCSKECHITYKQEQRLREWLAGDGSVATDSWGLSKWARDYLLAEANYTCSVCDWNELHPTDNLPTVQPDHIDGNAMNNVKSNLRVLCPNHHSVTPFHGARNRGNGRDARRVARNKMAENDDTLDKSNQSVV